MNIKNLPSLNPNALRDLQYDLPSSVLSRWNPLLVEAKTDNNTIEIYDQIGDDGWGGGFKMNRLSAALRSIGSENDVVVSINSPGGSFFEGVSIYNTLREHKGRVTVRVAGLAASAASVIAMAGDEIEIAESAFMMIHNSWALAMGNRHDMMTVAETLTQFDDSMAGVYAARSGKNKSKIKQMMDDETWMSGSDAVKQGFADIMIENLSVKEEDDDTVNSSLRRIDIALAKDGVSRSQRRAMIKEISGTPSAAQKNVTPSADDQDVAILNDLLQSLNSIVKGK